MLFHSFIFVLGFLPVSVIGYWLINRYLGWSASIAWLLAASLFFYAQWSYIFTALLIGSIVINYAMARSILSVRIQQPNLARVLLLCAIAGNLAYLGYFKYANFFIDNVNLVLSASFQPIDLLLPVGISFYTFIQIGYLIDVYNGQVREHRFDYYALFSGFFPYITAGPLVLQKEMWTQFSTPREARLSLNHIAIGLAMFSMGLFKKVVFADSIGGFADEMFDGVAIGIIPATIDAWLGSLAYTLQLYFDFSGYSDMALGIGFLFGFKLPFNFNSPLKARSIIDFWRRWHITMTRFFTTYVHSPIAMALMRRSLNHGDGLLGKFLLATAFPIMVTFVLAGIWHGAGWTFVVFGLIHGIALAINHGWRATKLPPLPYPLGWLLTMVIVVLGLVFFRAGSVNDAITILSSMTDVNVLGSSLISDSAIALAWICSLGVIVLAFPNTLEIIRLQHLKPDDETSEERSKRISGSVWRSSAVWATCNAFVLMLALGSITRKTVFLYYQF